MTTEALNPELFLPPPLYIHLAPSNLPLLFPTPLPLFGPSGSCIGLRPPPPSCGSSRGAGIHLRPKIYKLSAGQLKRWMSHNFCALF